MMLTAENADVAGGTPGVWHSVRGRLGKTFIGFVYLQVLMHIVHGVSYVANIQSHVWMTAFLLAGDFSRPWGDENTWIIHSPAFLLMVPVFNLSSWQAYLIGIYVATQVLNLLICWLVSRYDIKYALLFLSAGWVVTVSWWMGYPDIITVVLLVVLYRYITAAQIGKGDGGLIILFMTLTAFNHAGIALLSVLILTVFAVHKKRALIFLSVGYVIGTLLISLYLLYVNYDGYGRLDALFRPPNSYLVEAPVSMNAQFPWAVYSAFYGVLFYLAVQIYNRPIGQNAPLLLAIVIALGGAALGTDTSRLLSIFVIPILLYTLDYAQKHPIPDPRLDKGLFAAAIVLPLIIGEYHIWEGEIQNAASFKLSTPMVIVDYSILNVVMDIGQQFLTGE